MLPVGEWRVHAETPERAATEEGQLERFATSLEQNDDALGAAASLDTVRGTLSARGVHKLGRRPDPPVFQRDRIYAPHGPGGLDPYGFIVVTSLHLLQPGTPGQPGGREDAQPAVAERRARAGVQRSRAPLNPNTLLSPRPRSRRAERAAA
jgi:hypothetical protein